MDKNTVKGGLSKIERFHSVSKNTLGDKDHEQVTGTVPCEI